MDLKDIEIWGRELLQNEARKRGVKNPELFSRGDLIRQILRHDYGTPRNVREAARLIGGLFDSAKGALKSRFAGEPLAEPRWTPPKPSVHRDAQPPAAPDARDAAPEPADPQSYARVKPEAADAAEVPRARARARRDRQSEAPPPAPLSEVPRDENASQPPDAKSEPPSRESGEFTRASGERESGEIRLNAKPSEESVPPAQTEPEPGLLSGEPSDAKHVTGEVRATATTDLSQTQTISKSARQRAVAAAAKAEAAESATPVPAEIPAPPPEPVPDSGEHLLYGPHPEHGLLLRWRVSPEAVERARAVLGSDGELAVRIVTVRVDPRAVVQTDILDHGPITDVGDWTAPLVPSAARYVSAIGLRTPARFVSIVHATT